MRAWSRAPQRRHRARRQPTCSAVSSTAPASHSMAWVRIECEASVRLTGTPINPLLRQPITQPLDVGVRAINAC